MNVLSYQKAHRFQSLVESLGFPKIIKLYEKTSIDTEIFTGLIEIAVALKDTAVLDALECITLTKGFNLNLCFLSKEEKNKLVDIFAIPKEEDRRKKLSGKYGLN